VICSLVDCKTGLPAKSTKFMKITVTELNEWCCKATPQDVACLSDEQILGMAMERPSHPGTYGFKLAWGYFNDDKHLSTILYALLKRLQQVENYMEKMKEREIINDKF
jgi:hypothetical protein